MRKYWKKIKSRIARPLKRIHVPGYRPLTVYDFALFYGNALAKGNITQRAAAMTFYFLLAMFPLIIFLFSVIPFIPVDGLQESMLLGIKKALPTPDVYAFFKEMLEDLLLNKHTGLLSFSFLLGIYFSSNAIYSVLTGLNNSYYIRAKGRLLSQKIWSIGLLFMFIILFILSFLISSVSGSFLNWLSNHEMVSGNFAYWALTVLKLLLSFFFFIMGISILYNVANTEKIKWKFFSAGAVASAVLILLFNEIFSWYLSSFNSYNTIYGPLGTILIFLLFVFYVFIMLMIGFEMNTSLQRAYRKTQDANPLT
ncbi:MAG: YihY/virulence factor BrkB family protein [Flavobacteriales bacterium]